jgi:hypothetical protein
MYEGTNPRKGRRILFVGSYGLNSEAPGFRGKK